MSVIDSFAPTRTPGSTRFRFTIIEGEPMDGYMIDVACDEQTLSVRGKNKAARIALAGEAHGDGDVVIPRFTIAGVRFKGANMLVNGNLIVTTTDGRKYQLHFRRKQQADFKGLAEELAGALPERLQDSDAAVATVWDLPGQDGTFSQEVVGESFHVEQFTHLLKGVHVDANGIDLEAKASLVPEPRNEYDPLAVAVVIRGQIVGHLPREDAARFQPTLLAATKAGRDPQVDALLHARADEDDLGKVWHSVRLDLASLEVISAG